jgi:hypothetical protein
MPSIVSSFAPRGRSRRGTERSSPAVYGCSGFAKTSRAVACSVSRAAYITFTRSA